MNRKVGEMLQTKITRLSLDQAKLLPAFREKWRALTLSTEPVDPETVVEAVKLAYTAIGLPKPEVLFFPSPYAAF